jgi:hypothetical protein
VRFLLLLLFASGCATTAHGTATGRRAKAAIAIRDHVPGYQKVFTMQYTVPRLREAYDGYWYLTATEGDSKREEFLQALHEATSEYRVVDVFLLAHSNRYIDWVATLPEAQRRRIRLVYDTGCGDVSQAQDWLSLGVRSFVGHGDDNVAPVFYVSFLPAWLAGRSLEESVEIANGLLRQRLFNPFLRPVFQSDDALYLRTRGVLFRSNPHPDPLPKGEGD